MSLFRDRALQRISSPERLEEALTAAAPRHWLAFLGAFLVIAAAIAWGFFGTVPTRVSAEGILMDEGSEVFNASAEAQGQLVKFLVPLGATVTRGQPLALVKQAETESRLKRARDSLKLAEKRLAEARAERGEQLASRTQLTEEQRQTLTAKIGHSLERENILNTYVADMRSLRERGLAPRSKVLDIEKELVSARETIADLRNQLLELDVQMLDHRERQNARVLERQKEVERLRERTADLQETLKLGRTVDAPVTGTMSEIAASLGDVMSPGTPVMRITTHAPHKDVLLFVDPAEGKRINPGMEVRVEPSVVKKEEYGTIRGTVSSVSALPVSRSAIEAMLHNETLVETFTKEAAPIAVRARLEEQPSSASGFAWSGGDGPPFAIKSGTLADATVTVRSQPPVTLILPFLRSLLGV